MMSSPSWSFSPLLKCAENKLLNAMIRCPCNIRSTPPPSQILQQKLKHYHFHRSRSYLKQHSNIPRYPWPSPNKRCALSRSSQFLNLHLLILLLYPSSLGVVYAYLLSDTILSLASLVLPCLAEASSCAADLRAAILRSSVATISRHKSSPS